MKSFHTKDAAPGSGGVSGFWLHEYSASGGAVDDVRASPPIREISANSVLMQRRAPRLPRLRGPERGDFPSGDSMLCCLLPHGGHFQKRIVTDVKSLLVLFPDAVIDFLAIHADIFRHFKAEFDLAALYLEYADTNIVANVDAFACTSA